MEHHTYQHQGLLVRGIDPDSIAAGFDLPPDSRLVKVNDKAMPDLFAFRLAEGEEALCLLFWHEAEGLFEIEVEKDADEPLGLDLEIVTNEVFTHCHNGCVFCFIDQLPKGMRETLYFKDDDMRLSFLHGNYITLTNLKDSELDRLIALRFSPLNVSVHTTDPALRKTMMRNRFAGDVLEKLARITDAGIDLNVQIVLCPDLNDKAHLQRTFDDLAGLNRRLRSVACVPVGLTRYRDENKLFPLRPHTPEECRDLIASVHARQRQMLQARGERLFYLADEFYLKAGEPLPSDEAYEDYAQLENGVGTVTRFRTDLGRLLETNGGRAVRRAKQIYPHADKRDAFDDAASGRHIANGARLLIVTGRLAAPVLAEAVESLNARFGLKAGVIGVENAFFGEHITVAGLLTGQDILSALRLISDIEGTCVVLPDNMLKAGSEWFLDDCTVTDLRQALGVSVVVVPETADALWRVFAEHSGCQFERKI